MKFLHILAFVLCAALAVSLIGLRLVFVAGEAAAAQINHINQGE